MPEKEISFPNRVDVERISKRVFDDNPVEIERFPTGSFHFVFDVKTQNNKEFVVRIARPENRNVLQNAVFWNELLRPKGVPLPEILFSDTGEPKFPFIILERLKGQDLGFVYKDLSKRQKKLLAKQLAKIQEITATVPMAKSFGFVENYETDALCPTWTDVIKKSLDCSRERIRKIGIFKTEAVERVEEKIAVFEDYFSEVEPRGFLDDITTKNVIVHNGELSGIVDVDWICFGDNLFTIALTGMSLLLSQDETDYIDYWLSEMNVSAERKKVLDFYTAVFCVDFMSEIGQTFNKETPLQIDEEKFARLHLILERLLASV